MTIKHMKLVSIPKGFSLMEMAIVLMIIGTLLSGVLVAVSQTTENNRRVNALAQLKQIEEAIYGYAQSTGAIPCPASSSSNGQSLPNGNGCTFYFGFVPAATLNLYGSTNSDGLLLDPWQNPYRYAVDDSQVFTSAAPLNTFYNAGTAVGNMLRVCETNLCAGGETINNSIPALILSMGADWPTCTSANEIENSCEDTATMPGYGLPDDDDFVLTTYSEDQFDDQLVWLSPYVLFNKLITAGKLP